MLMKWCTDSNPGVLDFQDAVYGPVTHDLVSLLRDAYIEWDEERQIDWAVRYWEKARAAGVAVDADFGNFWRDFEWMGVQRQIKVLGIFARLCHRDGKRAFMVVAAETPEPQETQSHVTLMLNFFDEVRRRVGGR